MTEGRFSHKLLNITCIIAAAFGISAVSLRAETVDKGVSGHLRTQEIQLQTGWNAVYLEVDPVNSNPNAVFAGLPIEQAAGFFPGTSSTQFVSDPNVDLLKGRGWGVWYAPNRPEAFLKSIDAIYGNQPYLIKATQATTWKVRGVVKPAKARWLPDSYNLIGFSVTNAGPTFGQFFSSSKAHQNQAIYRLVNNSWKKVAQPSAETMRSGEAFWIYTKGSSDFQGPLKVEQPLQQGMLLGRGRAAIILRNETNHPLTPSIEHVVGEGDGLPLSVVVRTIGDPAEPMKGAAIEMPATSWAQPLPPLEIGGAMAIPFECRASQMSTPLGSSLLKITSDLGTITWVPVQGIRDDLAK